jgi:L-2-hydroxyglutarate oxidase LhgO
MNPGPTKYESDPANNQIDICSSGKQYYGKFCRQITSQIQPTTKLIYVAVENNTMENFADRSNYGIDLIALSCMLSSTC